MNDLLPAAERIGALLKQRHETIAIAESSSAGLIAASMLSVSGASAYFIGGAVFYTRKSIQELLGLGPDAFGAARVLDEQTALVIARAQRERLDANWGVAEIGAAGPTGSRYGDPAGTTCVAVVGAGLERALKVQTGSSDRIANMRAFAAAALRLLEQALA